MPNNNPHGHNQYTKPELRSQKSKKPAPQPNQREALMLRVEGILHTNRTTGTPRARISRLRPAERRHRVCTLPTCRTCR